jgi:hypothetical protein
VPESRQTTGIQFLIDDRERSFSAQIDQPMYHL